MKGLDFSLFIVLQFSLGIFAPQRLHAANSRKQVSTELRLFNTDSASSIDFKKGQKIRALPPPPSAWFLSLDERRVVLKPTTQTLKRRLEATLRHAEFSEAIRLNVNPRHLQAEVIRLATPPVRELFNEQNVANSTGIAFLKGIELRLKNNQLKLDARDLSWLNLDRLASKTKQRSVLPQLATTAWSAAVSKPETMLRLKGHFGSDWERIRNNIARKIETESEGLGEFEPEETVSLYDFLPEHIQEIYGRYSSFRGRNCFATALLFSNEEVISDKTVNMIREDDHHFAMINSDEFYNALNRGFTELNSEQIANGLKFGDVVAFVDRANGEGYKTLLHAAVHIAGTYYFHKPSKSASTPVEFTRFEDIIKIWRPFAQDLDYRVYRKLPIMSANYIENSVLDEKIDWTP